MILVRTFLETKEPVGRLGCRSGYGRVRPTGMKRSEARVSIDGTVARCQKQLTGNSDGNDDEEIDVEELEVAEGRCE